MNTQLPTLVMATNNPHKLHEIREILEGQYRVMSLDEIGCHDDIPETAETLEGNALIKARWVKERYGYDCFADDTGLEVEALGGAPGVYSARWAGPGCTPADNVAKMLRVMQGQSNRRARFRTVIALIKDGKETLVDGTVDGEILDKPVGDNGFGYDPIFSPSNSGVSFAQMTDEQKNSISHRGRATRALLQHLANTQ
ncbi:MAG: RdgB/HAM1 family non-canonical purine NTP pyrophosphatase [Muribaculaceae bacterium]|nr:RdgB/HAM1 family non-canonical purine NTP pyrophosphatase [Muribaculaceae bacterium]MDE6322056.1 RdgB/HAM1 family non-canonical purine NTP pyrophosphatase [Muribaculaceae bacterium]